MNAKVWRVFDLRWLMENPSKIPIRDMNNLRPMRTFFHLANSHQVTNLQFFHHKHVNNHVAKVSLNFCITWCNSTFIHTFPKHDISCWTLKTFPKNEPQSTWMKRFSYIFIWAISRCSVWAPTWHEFMNTSFHRSISEKKEKLNFVKRKICSHVFSSFHGGWMGLRRGCEKVKVKFHSILSLELKSCCRISSANRRREKKRKYLYFISDDNLFRCYHERSCC